MSFKIDLTKAQKTELKRDLVVFVGALLATGVFDTTWNKATLTAAAITALKVTARQVLPHDTEAEGE